MFPNEYIHDHELSTYYDNSHNNVLKKFFSTRGRINRKEYSITLLLFLILAIIILSFVPPELMETKGFDGIVLQIISIIGGVFISSKRFHDINRSAYWILCPLSWIFILFIPGVKGSNKYGPEPK